MKFPFWRRKQLYEVDEVFTPTSPARVNFVKRPALTDDLSTALRTPGTQIVLYGECVFR